MDYKASSGRSGYTLPVFACAAAIAAFRKLFHNEIAREVCLNLITPAQDAIVPIEQVANTGNNSAIAICRSDPGDNLDITKNTPIWAQVTRGDISDDPEINIKGGEGIGRFGFSETQPNGTAAIYGYAKQLIQESISNELKTLPIKELSDINISIILPEGEGLARRTSNEAFGVVKGLSLLGTSGISQALNAPEQLDKFQEELKQKSHHHALVFCLGENGLDIARNLSIPEGQLIKTANWIGPMLALAGQQQMPSILLLGYHGKLIKLAGGIFHTHHHLADGRQEILSAIAGQIGLPHIHIRELMETGTVEACLQYLLNIDAANQTSWTEQIYQSVTQRVELRAQQYIQTHSEFEAKVGCVLFNRSRQIFTQGEQGQKILKQILASSG